MRIFKGLVNLISLKRFSTPPTVAYKILPTEISDDQHGTAAEKLGKGKEEVPKELAAFMHAASSQIFTDLVKPPAGNILMKVDYERTLALLSGGMLQASQKFGITMPEIVIIKDSDVLSFSPTKEGGRVNIGEISVRRFGYNQFFHDKSVCAHATHVALDAEIMIHLAGFEEIVHAHNFSIDPDNMIKWGESEVRGKFQTRVRDCYCKNPAEVYAGFYVREEIRRKCDGNDDVIKKTYETDMFMIKLYECGRIPDLPDYIVKVMDAAREDLAKNYPEGLQPVAPLGMTLKMLEPSVDESKWQDQVQSAKGGEIAQKNTAPASLRG